MLSLSLLTLVACVTEPVGAPYGAQVVVPDSPTYALEAAYATAGDGAGQLYFGTIMVLGPAQFGGGATDVPLNNIRVNLVSNWTGAYLVPEGAVKSVNDLDEACEGGASTDESCAAWYDTEGERYFELSGEYEAVDDIRPTYLQAVTDNRGLLNFYVFVDSAPSDSDGTSMPFSVYVDIGVDSDSITFEPASE
jgi:hypothetical protein